MTVIGRSTHALFFNGVSDGVVVPQAAFDKTGLEVDIGSGTARSSMSVMSDGNRARSSERETGRVANSFSVEAWVTPDCGGVIAVKDDLFELRMGSVGAPAIASFSVNVQTGNSTRSVRAMSGEGATGALYPTNGGSFINNGSGFNSAQRELYHVVGMFTGEMVKLYVNGELIAAEKLNGKYTAQYNDADLFIGGRGGQYRGHIHGVHWRRGYNESGISLGPLVPSGDTIGLWRFEEPVSVESDVFYITSSPSAGATTFNISTAQAQTLYEVISGKNDTLTGTYTPEGLGSYQVANNAHGGGAQTIQVAHRPFNLLINPTGTDVLTGRPNNKAPERVRLVSVSAAGVVTIESIHLDFHTSASTGMRGLLHARTAFNTANNLAGESAFVIIKADLLIDSQTGKPFQQPGLGSQAIDRTGQMLLDEGGLGNHGFFFSRRIEAGVATNPFRVTAWTLDERFQIGHTGRHYFSHTAGHPYLQLFPTPVEEEVTRTMDGISDEFRVSFSGQSVSIKDQVPIGSKVHLHRQAFTAPIKGVHNKSTAVQVIRNGLASIDAHRDGVIAIGGAGFDVRPFLLKGHGAENVVATDGVYNLHLTPETESRVALLQVSGLSIPYVEIHYNAVDLLGTKVGAGGPALLVEKTVPDGGSLLDGKRVAQHIADAVGATGGATLHAPGGVLVFDVKDIGAAEVAMKSHRLVGDNTGGRLSEVELDESSLPSNYTPVNTGDPPRAPPKAVDASHVIDATHPSVYHRVVMRPRSRGALDPPVGSAPDHYRDAQHVSGRAWTTQSTHTNEVYDVIDNYTQDSQHLVIIQPSDRSRTMQLSKAVSQGNNTGDPSHVSMEFLQSSGRVHSFKTGMNERGRSLLLMARGFMDDIANVKSDFLGDGSPDSHTVKEIQPGAPVVTVTLGGAGQGAVNTKPTWDPSPLSRIGWNTRHSCKAIVTGTGSGIVNVAPLNNTSTALASWGTYCFPMRGRIYLENGASAEYYTKTASVFSFVTTTSIGTGRYLKDNGGEIDLFADWLTENNVVAGTTIELDPLFNEESVCADGTTVNDRMFQSIGSVSHDYQLGTQYASTRSMVEIPVFPYHFFEDRDAGIFPGPDNSMKIHLDATLTSHTWAPNPVGRRCPSFSPADREIVSLYGKRWKAGDAFKTVTVTQVDTQNMRVYVDEIARIPDSSTEVTTVSSVPYSNGSGYIPARNLRMVFRPRCLYLPDGEYLIIKDVDRSSGYIELHTAGGIANQGSVEALKGLEVGVAVSVGEYPDDSYNHLADDPLGMTGIDQESSASQEYRSPFYHDRANVQTQGGNIDYGLRQYVSAVEFKAGPTANPHTGRIESGCVKLNVVEVIASGPPPTVRIKAEDAEKIPWGAPTIWGSTYHYKLYNPATGNYYYSAVNAARDTMIPQPHPFLSPSAPAVVLNDVLIMVGIIVINSGITHALDVEDAICNNTWNNPYAPGGLRYGDTVWMNMHYTNPHAMEGLFCKSRGVFNEYLVWNGFNGGKAVIGKEARDSVPIENFLIGDDCIETARNFVQHVNRTVALNYEELGLTDPPTVAFLDPYLATQGHARVLLYDGEHDREFIALHDIHMQVQSSAKTPEVEGLDVANGFRSQIKTRHPWYGTHAKAVDILGNAVGTVLSNATPATGMFASVSYGGTNHPPASAPATPISIITANGKSDFIESVYSHNQWFNRDWNMDTATGFPLQNDYALSRMPNYIKVASDENIPCPSMGGMDRNENTVCCPTNAEARHAYTMSATEANLVFTDDSNQYEFISTFHDTPDGTRAIPAFLCLKGKRTVPNSISDDRNNLPHWTHLDFTRRLTLDLGEVGVKEGVTDIEAAARELVRMVNQAGAPNGRSNQRRPADQYPGEGELLDLTMRSTNTVPGAQITDPSAAHHHADFAVTGSTHDPAPFWQDEGFDSYDRGSHMGYLRAHLGRVVTDIDGMEGFSIVVHSTIPGAAGRNFCAWLDNSRAQSAYRPQYLIGHGGRFRNYFCMPEELTGENMHPAPMPIDKNGKPFAPITTLRELLPADEDTNKFENNLNVGHHPTYATAGPKSPPSTFEIGTGRQANTVYGESYESKGQGQTLVEGLRVGSRARARVNFGGFTAAGYPGWAPDAGRWGFGAGGTDDTRYTAIYQSAQTSAATTYNGYVPTTEQSEDTVGTSHLYGLKMVDHLGKQHIIRMVYREYGKPFALNNTPLPATLDNEMMVWFDDRDVTQGGFTIGRHMWGKGDPSGHITTGTLKSWRGNLWRTFKPPMSGYAVTVDGHAAIDQTKFKLKKGLYGQMGAYGDGVWNTLPKDVDVLGYMGFPETDGMIWCSVPGGSQAGVGHVFHYTHRTTMTSAEVVAGSIGHTFYGVTGDKNTYEVLGTGTQGPTDRNQTSANTVVISPMLNQTSILTDEVIAAAMEMAFMMDPTSDGVDDTSLDISEMFAPDGRTYAEWMGEGAKTAVRVKAFSDKNDMVPLRDLFTVQRSADWGIHAGSTETDQATADSAGANSFPYGTTIKTAADNAHIGGLPRGSIIGGTLPDNGYLPRTLLHITTRYRGTNANTATPILVDSANNAVDVATWRRCLQGTQYVAHPGDLISPHIESPALPIDNYAPWNGATSIFSQTPAVRKMVGTASSEYYLIQIDCHPQIVSTALAKNHDALFHFGGPPGMLGAWKDRHGVTMGAAGAGSAPVPPCYTDFGNDPSWSEEHKLWLNDEDYLVGVCLGEATMSNTVGAHASDNQSFWFAVDAARSSKDVHKLLPDPWVAFGTGGSAFGGDTAVTRLVAMKNGQTTMSRKCAGLRLSGSTYSEPFLYFRGAQDSTDHSVPLYFGGGFSGVVLDVNDGSKTDYGEFYTHPYATGPTGCAGLQNVGEKMGAHCILDTTALLAMFPGTAYLDQHRGETHPPFMNADAVLLPDLDGTGGIYNVPGAFAGQYTKGGGNVHMTAPAPVTIRFAHPYTRYTEPEDTAYIIFGPGQSAPKHWAGEGPADYLTHPEPSVKWTVQAKGYHLRAGVPTTMNVGTAPNLFFPNDLYNHDGVVPPAAVTGALLPPTAARQALAPFPHKYVDNWEFALGKPNHGFDQYDPRQRRCVNFHWSNTANTTIPVTKTVGSHHAHPFDHYNAQIYAHGHGKTDPPVLGTVLFHGDGGYAPGGNWMDNAVQKNPPHPVKASVVSGLKTQYLSPHHPNPIQLGVNATMFRVGAAALDGYDETASGAHSGDVFVIDATRVQNSEELAATIAAAINTWPGRGHLKALGGTFLPSFQDAGRQDRYGWVDCGPMAEYLWDATGGPAGGEQGLVRVGTTIPETLPAYGWIRIARADPAAAPWDSAGVPPSMYGFYYGFNSALGQFNLGLNRRFGKMRMEAPPHETGVDTAWHADPAFLPYAQPAQYRVYVWAKTGNHRWCNGAQTKLDTQGEYATTGGAGLVHDTIFDHLAATQVHFNGFVDAVDRTRPVGAIGWHGERYSYLNSLQVVRPSSIQFGAASTATYGLAAGKGAWHPFLGFSPYGHQMSCHSRNDVGYTVTAVGSDPIEYQVSPVNTQCPSGVHPRHYVVITHEGELPIIAKADREGVFCGGDLLNVRWGNLAGPVTEIGSWGSNGSGYTNGKQTALTTSGGTGSGCKVNCYVVGGVPKQITIHTAGTGYKEKDVVTIAGGGGSGATFVVTKIGGLKEHSGTVQVSHPDRHNTDRYVAWSNGGPHIEAQYAQDTNPPRDTSQAWIPNPAVKGDLYPMDTCLFPTGDLFLDKDVNPGNAGYPEDVLFTSTVSGVGAQGGKIECVNQPLMGYLDMPMGGPLHLDMDMPGPTTQFHGMNYHANLAWSGVSSGYSPGVFPLVYANVGALGHGSGEGAMIEIVAVSGSGAITNWRIVDGGFGYKAGEKLAVDGGGAPVSSPGLNAWLDVVSTQTWRGQMVTGQGGSPQTFWRERMAGRNFFPEHAVWKRMGGGNVCLPAVNARGLGAVPWVTRKVDSTGDGATDTYKRFGETLLGNVRFTFETTNAVMFPIIQAQELAHPQLAEEFPYEIRNALEIPNEEEQFIEITVVDDTGQTHTVSGGSPFGTIIRDFDRLSDRDTEGLAPALARSGEAPNMRIRLPDHDTIPGNILVRSGFDRLQAYQHESMGSGGLQHPTQPTSPTSSNFASDNKYPSTGPTWENEGWEAIDSRADTFPYSRKGHWDDDNPLKTAYEPHDRALYFHVTKMGHTHTTREPIGYHGSTTVLRYNPLTYVSHTADTVTVNTAVLSGVWKVDPLPDGRYFAVIGDSLFSYTNVAGSTFTGCVFTPDFTATVGASVSPSFYVPAGSTRHFAGRRLRDHAEVSGESPDKPVVDITGDPTTTLAQKIRLSPLTPMPLPRMGHHYVTPTMAMLPGHTAHPVYQRLFMLNQACKTASNISMEEEVGYTNLITGQTAGTTSTAVLNSAGGSPRPLVWFSTQTAMFKPSDIHGDAFTLMFETKVRHDGYGIADSTNAANAAGGHRISLEKGTNYAHHWNFPDPLEVGAYQIVIQPNLFAQQILGNNANTPPGNANPPVSPGPSANTTYPFLTDQQVATVIAVQWDASATSFDLVLAEATKADVRGCEIYINEVMLDIDPSPHQQFASVPTLGLFNSLGVNAGSSGAFTRRSLPYRPGMFRSSTPGYTITVPWWSAALKTSSVFNTVNNYRRLEHYQPDDYYHFCRSTLGAVASQITLVGYPTHYLDYYTHAYSSFAPTCVIERFTIETPVGTGVDGIIVVDNNDLFPLVGRDYYSHQLEVTHSDGEKEYGTYTSRGYSSGQAGENTTTFTGVSGNARFWASIGDGVTLRLSSPYALLPSGAIYMKSRESVATRNLPQLLTGTRDTNSLHMADAYLCLWHHNLGRPMTWYSDSRASATAAAVDKQPYNHLPEHFETVHYHEFTYAISDGPLDFRMKAWESTVIYGADAWALSGSTFPPQARPDTLGSPRKYHYGAFWPSGHRFGAQMTRLDHWGDVWTGWGQSWDTQNIFQSDTQGLVLSSSAASSISATIGGISNVKRNLAFGHRFAVRQPYNRPRWAIRAAQGLTDPRADVHIGHSGPFVQRDTVTQSTYGENFVGADTTTATAAADYVGIMERITNASALTGSDLKLQQVRYSHGRRMNRSFGCPLRNIVNDALTIRHHPGDRHTGTVGKTDATLQRRNLLLATSHYIVDWWGNSLGEDVRRYPVRGFGIRPSWDPEDAYRATDRTKSATPFYVPEADHGPCRALLDFFDPATAKRVGDRGDGRGVRWPTVFNEDVLQDVSVPIRPMGMALSHHTSEPAFTPGYLRPRNDALQDYEVPRGISARLQLAASDGLLKPEAMVGTNIEYAETGFLPANETHLEPISRISPRIGLDTLTTSELTDAMDRPYVTVGTEAHSLHTDRGIGRRYIVAAGIKTDTRAVADFDLTLLNFSSFKQVMRLNYTHGMMPLGGSFILDLANYLEPVSDHGWGRSSVSSSNRSSNPYQTNVHNSLSAQTNTTDKLIRLLLRPVRVLDHRHIEVFRDKTNALAGTAAGRYGVFAYDTPNARAASGYYLRGSNPGSSNPPYAPVYLFDTSNYVVPVSKGPKIPGSESSTFQHSLRQTVARITPTQNTLQHYRGDAIRRQSVTEGTSSTVAPDFNVQPRHTQTLEPGTKQNTSSHTGESDHTDNELIP